MSWIAGGMFVIASISTLAFGGYNAYKNGKDVCDKSLQMQAKIDQFEKASAQALQNLQAVDQQVLTDTLALLTNIADTNNSINGLTKGNQSKYTMLQVVIVIMLIVVAAMFLLKRENLLTLDPLKPLKRK
jgi:hypothetical protein